MDGRHEGDREEGDARVVHGLPRPEEEDVLRSMIHIYMYIYTHIHIYIYIYHCGLPRPEEEDILRGGII